MLGSVSQLHTNTLSYMTNICQCRETFLVFAGQCIMAYKRVEAKDAGMCARQSSQQRILWLTIEILESLRNPVAGR